MTKKRVHEIAKEQGLSSKELLEKLKAAGVEAKAATSSVEEAIALKALGTGAAAGNGVSAAADTPAAASTPAVLQRPWRRIQPPASACAPRATRAPASGRRRAPPVPAGAGAW